MTTHALSELLDGTVPAIAVSFADEITDEYLDIARQDGLDVYELRIDRYSSWNIDHVMSQVRRFAGLPTIATIRTADEGGEWSGSDEERLALFRSIIPEVECIDIELQSPILPRVVKEAKAAGKLVIISNHNFESTGPVEDFEKMAAEAKAQGADLVKLSAMTRSPEDLRTLAQFTVNNAHLGLIVVGMGQYGTASRVFFPALGSRLTYAYSKSFPVSGQLTYGETFEELRRFYPGFNQKKIEELGIIENA